MTQRDRSTGYFGSVAIENQLLLNREVLSRERFVDFARIRFSEHSSAADCISLTRARTSRPAKVFRWHRL